MKKRAGLILLSAAAMVVLALSFPRAETPTAESLRIVTAAGAAHDFSIEIAQTPLQQATGLMFREHMAADAGMLFLFPDLRPASFWMKNTLIPLDMIFIAEDGRIVNIHENVPPQSLEPRRSTAPVKAVLELNGGVSARLGIAAGDRVEHKAFKTR